MKETENSIQLNHAMYLLLRYLAITIAPCAHVEHIRLRDDIERYLRNHYSVKEVDK